jgi:hypothetical protein
MALRLGVALLATSALVIASAIGAASHAQDGSGARALKLAEAAQTGGKKSVAPRTVTPRSVAPHRTITSTPRVTTRSKTVTPKQLGTQKTITTKRTVTPKVVTPKGPVTPKVVTPKTSVPKTAGPKTVGPTRLGLRAIGPTSTGKTIIRGRNYTVWRGTHRVRRDNRWAILAAISTLSVIRFGGADYYPYGYISATGPYCEGVTEDGCILNWEEVPTLEGPSVLQCVAYCPWQ